MEDRAIGIFDSGIGGLTVLKEIIKILPNENIIYCADTANTPYGNKSKQKLLNLSRQIVKFLIAQNVKLIVIACNTVSSNCFYELQKEFDTPIIEVLTNGLNAGIEASQNKFIGIIGTEATLQNHVCEKFIAKKNNNVKVFTKACPLFVPLAEEGWTNNKISYEVAKIYLNEFKKTQIDTLILSCTHYPLFIDNIKKILPTVKIIDPAKFTAIKVQKYLTSHKIFRHKNNPNIIFYTSDNPKKFRHMCNKILTKNYPPQNFKQKNF